MQILKMPNSSEISEAKDVYMTLLDISELLCTGLDPEALTVCVRLCEAGVNPIAIASIVRELRKEMNSVTTDQQSNSTVNNASAL